MIPQINPNEEQDTGLDVQHLMPVKAIVPQPMSPAAIEQIAVQPIPEEPSNPS
jgi:hypothetical protein